MKRLSILSTLCLALTFSAQSQDQKKPFVMGSTISTSKTSFKIETSDLVFFSRITNDFSERMTKYTCTFKTDRMGRYGEYALYFKIDDLNEITSLIQNYKTTTKK